jgi:hypothetical protein
MKSLIESIKLHWADFLSLFDKKPDYYYRLDANKDVQKMPCHEEECTCNAEVAVPQSSYEEDLLEPAAVEPVAVEESKEVPVEPVRTKAQLKGLSKLELQVIAENEGVKLSGKENKQQIVNKIVKSAL